MRVLTLQKNWRVHHRCSELQLSDVIRDDFLNLLHHVGYGTRNRVVKGTDLVALPKNMLSTAKNLRDLIDEIYPEFKSRHEETPYL